MTTTTARVEVLTTDPTSEQVAFAAGITYRQLDHWIRRGWLKPGRLPPKFASGQGGSRDWPAAEVAVACRMARLVAAGLTHEAAAELARAPGRHVLAPGITIEVEPMTGSLRYDEIPPERLPVLAATGRLDDHVGDLAAALTRWADRDDTRPQPEVRRAANTAVGAVDAMLAELHQLRARLLAEIRVSDDAAAVRADQLLTRGRGTP